MIAFGECLTTLLGDRLHDLVVDLQQVVAAHARLARHAGGDDDDVGVGGLRRSRSCRRRSRAMSEPSIGQASSMSSAMPAAFVSAMSMMTTSASSLSAMAAGHRRADVAGAADHGHFAIHSLSAPASGEHQLRLRAPTGRATPGRVSLALKSGSPFYMIRDDGVAELRALHLGRAFHQAREVVGDRLGGDAPSRGP